MTKRRPPRDLAQQEMTAINEDYERRHGAEDREVKTLAGRLTDAEIDALFPPPPQPDTERAAASKRSGEIAPTIRTERELFALLLADPHKRGLGLPMHEINEADNPFDCGNIAVCEFPDADHKEAWASRILAWIEPGSDADDLAKLAKADGTAQGKSGAGLSYDPFQSLWRVTNAGGPNRRRGRQNLLKPQLK